MRKQTFSSGEFSKICNINKKTLFYYDEINLLKPAVTQANGYRLYTSDQIDFLSRIKALQSVGLSLTEIKKQLNVEDASEGIRTLYEQKQKISDKIDELVTVRNALEQKLHQLEHYQQIGNHKLFIKNYEEEYLFLDDAATQDGIIFNYLMDGYNFGVILKATDELKIERKFHIVKKSEANYIKQKGKYIGVYFITEEDRIKENAITAFQLIKNSGYSISSNIYLQDIATDFINFPNGLIPFQITVPVTARNSSFSVNK